MALEMGAWVTAVNSGSLFMRISAWVQSPTIRRAWISASFWGRISSAEVVELSVFELFTDPEELDKVEEATVVGCAGVVAVVNGIGAVAGSLLPGALPSNPTFEALVDVEAGRAGWEGASLDF